MKADERNMADSQAKVYRGSLSPNHRFSFSSLVFKQAVWLVGGEGKAVVLGSQATFPGERRNITLVEKSE